MQLDSAQLYYFIEQVGLAAASFGVAVEDVTAVGKALGGLFDVRCGPPTTVIKAQGPQLQSICMTPDCVLAANATCDAYPAEGVPAVANATLAMGEGNATATAAPAGTGLATQPATASTAGSATGSVAGSTTPSATANAAGRVLGGAAAGAVALAAFLL
jgi:hypothetical protein